LNEENLNGEIEQKEGFRLDLKGCKGLLRVLISVHFRILTTTSPPPFGRFIPASTKTKKFIR